MTNTDTLSAANNMTTAPLDSVAWDDILETLEALCHVPILHRKAWEIPWKINGS